MIFSISAQKHIDVYHDSSLDGGGTWFGQEYIHMVRSRYPGRRFRHCFEWCSGAGYIGFGLLAHDLCERLFLTDLHATAITSLQDTVAHNAVIKEHVSWQLTDRVASIPHHHQFDLVVANPPHYLECPGDENYQRIAVDPGWQVHREFFENISPLLAEDGIILLQENQAGSTQGAEEFRSMIEANGLEIRDVIQSPSYWHQPGPWCQIYYIEIRAKK
jgi:methylase of polypeptide subunit release factors